MMLKKEEKEKNGIDKAKERDLPAKITPVAPLITADRAREKAAETPAKIVETKAAAIVNKRPFPCHFLRGSGPT